MCLASTSLYRQVTRTEETAKGVATRSEIEIRAGWGTADDERMNDRKQMTAYERLNGPLGNGVSPCARNGRSVIEMRNKFEGKCYVCGRVVRVGTGHFERHQGGWRVKHAIYSGFGRITCERARGDAQGNHACPQEPAGQNRSQEDCPHE